MCGHEVLGASAHEFKRWRVSRGLVVVAVVLTEAQDARFV